MAPEKLNRSKAISPMTFTARLGCPKRTKQVMRLCIFLQRTGLVGSLGRWYSASAATRHVFNERVVTRR
jgi:hypothetical protein